jgi:hypothetical protein
MSFQADSFVASHNVVVGNGYPIPVLGLGPATVRGGGYFEGPLYIGNPNLFPVAPGSLAVAPQTNGDIKSPAKWSGYFIGGLRVKGLILGDVVAATRAKPFVIDHPTKENKKLVHVALEGPENGVYVRGKLEGEAIIKLPEYWTKFVDPRSITVNITPYKYPDQDIYIRKIANNKVYLGSSAKFGIHCHYHVYGERNDIEKLKVEVDPQEYGLE